MSDPTTPIRPQGPPVPDKQKFYPVVLGALAFFAIFGGLAWWFNAHRDGASTEPVAEAEPVTPTATPPVAPTDPAADPAADPTNCTFVDDNRPQVGEKFILQCADGQYLAIGTYNGENFNWSEFEEYPQPK